MLRLLHNPYIVCSLFILGIITVLSVYTLNLQPQSTLTLWLDLNLNKQNKKLKNECQITTLQKQKKHSSRKKKIYNLNKKTGVYSAP